MKDSDKLFDVVGVSLTDYKVRIMARDKTSENAEVFVNIAVMRRGVEDEFFAPTPAGVYRDGDTWLSKEKSR